MTDSQPQQQAERIFFGSLELQEKQRLDKEQQEKKGSATLNENSVSEPGKMVDSDEEDPLDEENPDHLPFDQKTIEARERQKKMLETLEIQRRAREIAVPTSDELVQERLREIGEPIILFGETKPERRTRLRQLLAAKGITEGMPALAKTSGATKASEAQLSYDEPWYIAGTEELKEARLFILRDSIQRARERIHNEKRYRELVIASRSVRRLVEDEVERNERQKLKLYAELACFRQYSSEVGDERPVSSCSFSPDGKYLVTSSWSGICKVWDVDTFKLLKTLRGHKERVQSVMFHPYASVSQSPTELNVASCSADNTIKLWNLESASCLATLEGHLDRVNRLAFHPSGRFLASTSHDCSWILWDLETKKSLLEQEGHYKPVYGVAFQCDGSLIATVGLDAIGRIWDLRSGKPIWLLRGHAKQILAVDFAPNGYQLATGSDDHTIRIWDLRKKGCIYIIPAHASLISSVKFQPKFGNFIVSSAYDNTCKIWASQDWSLLKVLTGHEGKVTYIDISPTYLESDSQTPKFLASSSFDFTWKLWALDTLYIQGGKNRSTDSTDQMET
jgi:U4/U6 small nuclear ribonucleoprotein PRP4